MNYPSKKHCSYIGMAASAMIFICWFISAVLDGEWVLGDSALSNLGVSDSLLGSIFFSWGICIVPGFLWIIECISIYRTEDGVSRKYALVTIYAMVWLIGVGFVDQRFGLVHRYTAFTFMFIMAAGILLALRSGFFIRRRIYIRLTQVMFVVLAVMCFTIPFVIYEPTAIAFVALWAGMLAYAYGDSDGKEYRQPTTILKHKH
ncbi:MAG: hypothetical protein MJZ38_00190 [archaeon]|nr:hypothetical protein [archaeon]